MIELIVFIVLIAFVIAAVSILVPVMTGLIYVTLALGALAILFIVLRAAAASVKKHWQLLAGLGIVLIAVAVARSQYDPYERPEPTHGRVPPKPTIYQIPGPSPHPQQQVIDSRVTDNLRGPTSLAVQSPGTQVPSQIRRLPQVAYAEGTGPSGADWARLRNLSPQTVLVDEYGDLYVAPDATSALLHLKHNKLKVAGPSVTGKPIHPSLAPFGAEASPPVQEPGTLVPRQIRRLPQVAYAEGTGPSDADWARMRNLTAQTILVDEFGDFYVAPDATSAILHIKFAKLKVAGPSITGLPVHPSLAPYATK